MKYEVNVSRIGYASARFRVEAENEIEAKEKAIDQAGNYDFSEGDAEYECESVTPISEANEITNAPDEVERLAEAYNSLTCAEKDRFLRLTGNE